MAASLDLDNPGTRDKLRLLLGDTDVAGSPIWSDEELDVYITTADGNPLLSASYALLALSRLSASSAIMYRIAETLRVDKRDIPKTLRQLAKDYREAALEGAGVAEYIDAANVMYDNVTREDESELTTHPLTDLD